MVLHGKGINFEFHEVDLSNKCDEFLSVSPYGKVPVLRVNGTSLYELNVVNEYLDEVHDSLKLIPDDPEGRASARSWMAFADAPNNGDRSPSGSVIQVNSIGQDDL